MDKEPDFRQIYGFMHEGISAIVTASAELLSLNKQHGIDDALAILAENLKLLDYFDSFAFYKIRDLIDFEQSYCYPPTAADAIQKDVDQHIDNGTFAWALNTTHPVVVSGLHSGYNQVLVSLSTKRRIHGMFVANAKNKGDISGVTLDILQLILSITVFSIDNLQLTEQLTDYAQNLEEKVAERTRELEEARLRAEQSSKARSEFLANMSHEIRTPMNGVLGMLELLGETRLDKKQQHYVVTAQNSGNNMMVILNDILDLSKVESGKLVIEEEEFNLVEMIGDLVSLFAMDLQSKGVDLIVSIDPLIPFFLRGGQIRFWQVIMNLLGNAKKFTEQGEIYLTLTLNSIKDNEVDIAVSVRDTGIGIAEEALEKIFDSFEQADINTSRHYGRTGLGLTLCRRLTQMMGGDISVSSVPGKGSEFSFNVKMQRIKDAEDTFFLVKASNFHVLYVSDNEKVWNAIASVFESLNVEHVLCKRTADIEAQLAKLNDDNINLLMFDESFMHRQGWSVHELQQRYSGVDVQLSVVCNELNKIQYGDAIDVLAKPLQINNLFRYLQGMSGEAAVQTDHEQGEMKFDAHVLVVEDNDVNQMVASGMLESLGCKVTLAANGAIALDVLQQQTFDLILMDINMPVLSGCDATAKIRGMQKPQSDITIIALTANVLPEDVQSYLDAGMDDYLAKPFSKDKLREVIMRWLPHSRASLEKNAEAESLSKAATLDMGKLHVLQEMMGEGYDELVETYIARSQDLLEAILQNEQDMEKLIRDVHSLKGSSGTMGASKLFTCCETLEQRLRKGNYAEREQQVQSIAEELQRVHTYLRD